MCEQPELVGYGGAMEVCSLFQSHLLGFLLSGSHPSQRRQLASNNRIPWEKKKKLALTNLFKMSNNFRVAMIL